MDDILKFFKNKIEYSRKNGYAFEGFFEDLKKFPKKDFNRLKIYFKINSKLDEEVERFLKYLEKAEAILKEIKTNDVIHIKLPQQNRTNFDFVNDVGEEIKYINDLNLFYSPKMKTFTEINEYVDKVKKQKYEIINAINPTKLINILEKKIKFFIIKKEQDEFIKIFKSPSKTHGEVLVNSDIFSNHLPFLNRLLTCQLPFYIDNKLILPKKGYNKDLDAFVLFSSPNIKEIKIEEAKKIINDIYSEFCFKEEQDKVMAIANLITPACRGIFEDITNRTPLFLYRANRERAGKDYCAGIVSIVYDGKVIDYPPICNNEKNGNNSEELRKKITSTIKQGGRRMHFANNKGHLDNAVFEQVLTSETIRDRILGKSEEIELDNEIDFSLSANIGLTFTADMWHRCRPIDLVFNGEYVNNRKFKTPNLHSKIKKERGIILSAIYTLIKGWVDNGCPSNCTFTSFAEWGRVVGGIMTHHKLGDPTVSIQDVDQVGGDSESKQMKQFWKYMYNYQIKFNKDNFKMNEICSIITKAQNNENDEDLFMNYNLDEKSYRMSFGKKLRKYLNREFSEIKFKIHTQNEKSIREKYTWEKVNKLNYSLDVKFNSNLKETTKSGHLDTFGHFNTTQLKKKKKNFKIEDKGKVSKSVQVSTFEDFNKSNKYYLTIIKNIKKKGKGFGISFEDLLNEIKCKEELLLIDLNKLISRGDIYSPKNGYYKVI